MSHLSIIILVSTENPDNCPDLEISVNALGTGCSKITDVLENSLFEMDYSDLRYMTTKSPIEKNNYKLEIINLDLIVLEELQIIEDYIYQI